MSSAGFVEKQGVSLGEVKKRKADAQDSHPGPPGRKLVFQALKAPE